MPQTLDYARHATWQRRWRTRLIIGALLLLLVGMGWERYPAVRTQARLLYWEDKCVIYQAPPDQEIVSADPATQSAGTGRPQAWREFASLLYPASGFKGLLENNAVFLHERTSPKGNRRLVVIETNNPDRRFSAWNDAMYTVKVITLGTALAPPKDPNPMGGGIFPILAHSLESLPAKLTRRMHPISQSERSPAYRVRSFTMVGCGMTTA